MSGGVRYVWKGEDCKRAQEVRQILMSCRPKWLLCYAWRESGTVAHEDIFAKNGIMVEKNIYICSRYEHKWIKYSFLVVA